MARTRCPGASGELNGDRNRTPPAAPAIATVSPGCEAATARTAA